MISLVQVRISKVGALIFHAEGGQGAKKATTGMTGASQVTGGKGPGFGIVVVSRLGFVVEGKSENQAWSNRIDWASEISNASLSPVLIQNHIRKVHVWAQCGPLDTILGSTGVQMGHTHATELICVFCSC